MDSIDLGTGPTKKQEIYDKYLHDIQGIKFTPRQIDVLACLLHMRNQGKIAQLLDIESVRTVEAHIRDARQKLNNMATQQVIDFIERSGKKKYFTAYYAVIRIEALFKEKLKKIANLINRNGIIYLDEFSDAYLAQNSMFKHFLEHLATANIKRIKQSDIKTTDKPKKIFRLCVIGTVINDEPSGHYENVHLLFDDTINPKMISQRIDVDFTQSNYYLSTFQVIIKMLGTTSVQELMAEFQKEMLGMNEPLSLDTVTKSVLHKDKRMLLLLFLLPLFFFYGIYHVYENNRRDEIAITTYVQKVLPQFFEGLTLNNLTDAKAEKNLNILKQFDQVVDLIKSGTIQKYLDITKLETKDIINCIYNLNAISAYALFKEYDALKAQKVSEYAKSLAESYLSVGGQVPIDFSKLSLDETYTELSSKGELPKIYTITVYFLGRSYIYLKDATNAEKYLTLSAYLGKKLGLYHGILSIRNGLLVIKLNIAADYVKNGDYDKAREVLKESIKAYQELKKDKTEYTLDYTPYSEKQKKVVPYKDSYNDVDCNKRITKFYTKLIEITESKEEQKVYLGAINKLLNGDGDLLGMLDILHSNKLSTRILADNYNYLGLLLLSMYDKDIDFSVLKPGFIRFMNLVDGDSWNIIEQIFNLAKSISKMGELAKADACDGLIKIHTRMLKQNSLSDDDKGRLQSKIKELTQELKLINSKLSSKSLNQD